MKGFVWFCATDFLGGHRINPIWAKRVHELVGDTTIRYCPQWADLMYRVPPPSPANVQPGGFPVLNWQQCDDDIGTLQSIGDVYLNLNGVAPYAAGGSTCYMEGVEGCLWWNDPTDASKGLHFTPEKGQCSNPPDPDSNAIRDIAQRIVARYPNLALVSFLNEPDDRTSSAAIMNQTELRFGGDWSKTSAWVTNKFSRPFYEGASSAGQVPVAGGEFATPGFMAASLREQKQSGHVWDHQYTTIHLYAGAAEGRFPDGTLAALDAPGGWKAYIDELREKDGIEIGIEGRVIIGETGRDANDDADGYLDLVSELYSRGDIEAVCILGTPWDFFTKESVSNPDPMKNTYEPNDTYGKLQTRIQQMTSRHRPASHGGAR